MASGRVWAEGVLYKMKWRHRILLRFFILYGEVLAFSTGGEVVEWYANGIFPDEYVSVGEVAGVGERDDRIARSAFFN